MADDYSSAGGLKKGFVLSTMALSSQPVLIFLVLTALLFGTYSYFTLPAREDPELLVREAVIQTAHSGLDIADIEQLVTKPLEEALLTVDEIDEITSESQNGLSIIHVKIAKEYSALDIILEEVAETVAEVIPYLPQGTQPPRVIDDFGDVGVITLAIHGEDYTPRELTEMAEYVRTQLINVPGTKKIEILGRLERRVFIEVQDSVLARLGVPADAIEAAVARDNAVLSGATADLGDRGVTLNPVRNASAAGAVAATLLPLANGETMRLGDVALIQDGYEDPPRRKAYYNGENAVVLSIAMFSDESAINFSRRMNERIDAIIPTLPVGLDLSPITEQAEQVEKAVYGVSINILETLVIVLGVVVVFLGVRTGLIVGAIIPSVVLATLAIMGVFGMQLERMSLATLVIAVGILVDNGIVVAEDFKTRLRETGDRDEALRITSRELAFPLLSASLTTMVVFLPLLIMNTSSSEYTHSITYIIVISLSISWLFAMTVTTTLCHRFVQLEDKNDTAKSQQDSLVQRWLKSVAKSYEQALRTILRFRWAYLLSMIGIFALGGWLMGFVPQKFFPDSDRAQILVYADLPVGVTSRATDEAVQTMTDIVSDKTMFPGLVDHAAYVGFGGPRFVLSLAPVNPAPHSAFMVINAKDRQSATESIPELRNAFRRALPDVNARVSLMYLGPADPNVIQLQIKGPDTDYLMEKAVELEEMLLGLGHTIDVWHDWRGVAERMEIRIDRDQASLAGVTASDIAETVKRRVGGQRLGAVQDGDDLVPIVLRGFPTEKDSLEQLMSAPVFNGRTGASVPLGQVATIERAPGIGVIAREDLVRTLTVEARNLVLTPQDMQPILAEPLAAFSASLKPGHSAEFDGILEDTAENNTALAATMPIVLFLTVLLLIIQFKGFKRPVIILLSLPFIVFGAAVGLLVMQASFSFMVILGLFALLGLIINNAIVLVDRMDIELAEDEASGTVDAFEAIVRACTRRFQPIIMTTITTIIGFLPLILSHDVLFYGMASTMGFGLGISTLIVSLGLVPVLYALVFSIKAEPGKSAREDERDWPLPMTARAAE